MRQITFIVGESGCGKTYLRDNLIRKFPHRYCEIRSTVSREPRENEDKGAYHFTTHKRFENLINNNDLLQYVNWGGNYYGTTIEEYNQPQYNGLFICTPVGISDTINALRERGIEMRFTILLFFTTKDLLYKHGIDSSRMERGNILREFLDGYSDGNYEGVHIDFLTDKDVVDNLHYRVNDILN